MRVFESSKLRFFQNVNLHLSNIIKTMQAQVLSGSALQFESRATPVYKESANQCLVAACKYAGLKLQSNTKQAFYLDGLSCRTTRTLRASGLQAHNLWVCNPDVHVVNAAAAQGVHAIQDWSCNFLRDYNGSPFELVWLDYCSSPQYNHQDLQILFGRGLLQSFSVLAVTFCLRSKNSAEQLAAYIQQVYTLAAQNNLVVQEITRQRYRPAMILIVWQLKTQFSFNVSAKTQSIEPVKNYIDIDNFRFWTFRPQQSQDTDTPITVQSVIGKRIAYAFYYNYKHNKTRYWATGTVEAVSTESGIATLDYGSAEKDYGVVLVLKNYNIDWFLI